MMMLLLMLARSLATTCLQQLVKEIFMNSLPILPDTFDERMEAIYQLVLQLGHLDWADDLANRVDSLHHHIYADLGVPGVS